MESRIDFILKYVFLYCFGGLLYFSVEILWRGYSHWTMALLGGIIFVVAGVQNEFYPRDYPLYKKVLKVWGFTVISELFTGCIVNLWLGWGVWDYSSLPMNLRGQICLPYCLLFLPLCLLAIIIDDYIRYWVFHEEKPHYKII